jgi:hypothetical protein
MESFKLTNNSKVRFYNNHNNTFSLRQGTIEDGGTCVCATESCLKVCYDKNLRKLYKSYASVEEQNTSLVFGKKASEMYDVVKNTVLKWKLTGGMNQPYFRIHTGGDFFNTSYAKAWARVIKENLDVKFWVYTRSLFAVPVLATCRNLTLLLSCDNDNKQDVLRVYQDYKEYPKVAIAWMGEGFPAEIDDRPKLDCPEVTGKVKKLNSMGACARCRACVDRKLKSGKIRHVRFPIHR